MPATVCSWTLLLRLAMPATGAVEELAMLAAILLVLRLAMPATGAIKKLAMLATIFLAPAGYWC